MKLIEKTALNRYCRELSRGKEFVSTAVVPSYQSDENGDVVCVPIPEPKRSFARDGKAYELANIMYGALPEELAQVQMSDAMETAEKVTTECVRRFGKLEVQRKNLIESQTKEFN